MLLFIIQCPLLEEDFPWFQNIVCYCLSRPYDCISCRWNIFQNIVCYCLSVQLILVLVVMWHFKTSYVTVYPVHSRCRMPPLCISKHRMLLFISMRATQKQLRSHFKTSYVTVYPLHHCRQHSWSEISKHRMLLFINNDCIRDILLSLFQNIVCYCLSSCLHAETSKK